MDPNMINVREMIDSSPVRPTQYWIFATCILIAIMDGYDTAVVGVAGPALISQGLVDARSFSFVVSAGIVGFVPGMLLFGPAADQWGRKVMLAIAVVIFAGGSLLSAVSTDFTGLIVARLVTGIGVGGASPCFVSLAAEYAPQRLRTTIVTTLWAGVPGGGILGGVIAARYLASSGWQALFYFGAAAPMLTLVLLIFTVPESLSYLALKGGNDDKIRTTLRRIVRGMPAVATATFTVPHAEAVKSSVKSLFANGEARVTLPLWLAFFCSFGMTVMISQYTAVLLRLSGMPPAQIGTVFSFFYVGSVMGTIAAGPVMNRMVHTKATTGLLILAAMGSALFGFMTGDFVLAVIGITIAGFTAAAAIGALVALATELYPTSIRATGVGWSLAMSRVGATVGPLLSGLLVSWQITNTLYYSVVGCIALIGAAAVLLIHYSGREGFSAVGPASFADSPN